MKRQSNGHAAWVLKHMHNWIDTTRVLVGKNDRREVVDLRLSAETGIVNFGLGGSFVNSYVIRSP